jgi:hypothetical protein
MFKKIIVPLSIAVVITVASYCGLIWHNNFSAQSPSQTQITATWEKSVSWLTANRDAVLQDHNPILWWMIGESAKLTGDARLQLLFAEYRAAMNAGDAGSVWHSFFVPERYWGASFTEQEFAGYPDYNQYFLFGLTCSKQLFSTPVIQAQHQTDFCGKTHPFSPACVTHQLMGFRFAQRIGCDRLENLPDKIGVLQDAVVGQLRWDPRVVDVYLQRVLMLVDSGAPAKVKPRWLQRILAAQLADGSWSNMQPLLPLGGGRYLGFNERLVGLESLQGNLHATAQGIWLFSLLQQEANYRGLASH